jgi:hypothetical protein
MPDLVESAIRDAADILRISIRLGRFDTHVDEVDASVRAHARVLFEVMSADWDVPDDVRQFFTSIFNEKKKKPRRRGRYAGGEFRRRDVDILTVIEMVRGLGFNATRNETTKTESACSIVHQALCRLNVEMPESAINAIWGSRSIVSKTDLRSKHFELLQERWNRLRCGLLVK